MADAGYGVDIWCSDSMVSGRYARGPIAVALALFRRLITPRGMLRGGEDEQAGGLDLAEYVGAVGPATALAALPGLVRGELLKDDRVLDVSVESAISQESNGDVSVVLTIDVVLQNESDRFSLTVSADTVDAELLNIVVEA